MAFPHVAKGALPSIESRVVVKLGANQQAAGSMPLFSSSVCVFIAIGGMRREFLSSVRGL
jgi:hypothetical protein